MSLRELRAGTEEILVFAGLERFANLKLQHYSSGMASRLAFSSASLVWIINRYFIASSSGRGATTCRTRVMTCAVGRFRRVLGKQQSDAKD